MVGSPEPPHQNPRDQRAGSQRGRPGPARAILLLAITLAVTFAALQYVVFSGDSSADDASEAIAEGGCFDIDVEPVDQAPLVSRSEAEVHVRAYLTEFAEEHDLPYGLGSVRWAGYGRVVDGGNTVHRAPATGEIRWVFVFELNKQNWWRGFFGRRVPNRWTAIYKPGADGVSSCTGFG